MQTDTLKDKVYCNANNCHTHCKLCKVLALFYSNIYPTRCNVTQFILSGNCCTCFGWYHHPSSGAQTTVSTASGICHTVITICGYRGRVGTGLGVLWVAYWRTDQQTHYFFLSLQPNQTILREFHPRQATEAFSLHVQITLGSDSTCPPSQTLPPSPEGRTD